jgi:heterodisulfide reductase subunit C
MKCTSGCPAMKMLELMPHFITKMVSLGLVEEIIGSGTVWACMHCLACKERCPQKVAPVDLIFALRNSAVSMEAEVPEGVLRVVSSILEIGLIQKPQDVTSRELKAFNRESLGLPDMSYPSDKFKLALMNILQNE